MGNSACMHRFDALNAEINEPAEPKSTHLGDHRPVRAHLAC